MIRRILILSALFSAFSVHAQTTETVDLSNDEAISFIKGKKLNTENTRWGSVRLQFEENGTVYASGSNFSTSGKWKIVDGKLCMDGQQFDYEGCGALRRVGTEVQHLWPAGHVHFIVRQ